MTKYAMRISDFDQPSILLEGQNYEAMFSRVESILPASLYQSVIRSIGFQIPTNIEFAKTVLKRKDRITWFLRVFRLLYLKYLVDNLTYRIEATRQNHNDDDDEVIRIEKEAKKLLNNYVKEWGNGALTQSSGVLEAASLKQRLTHFMGLPCPAIQNYIFDRQSPKQLIDDLTSLEKEWKKKEGSQVVHRDQHNVILSFPDGFSWVDLGTPACDDEAEAMGHCGNRFGIATDSLLSLRKKMPNKKWRPSLTFVIDKDGYLGEMKGRGNEKPAKKYHPYIIALLKLPRVKGIIGGGYEPANNFSINDLTTAERQDLYKVKPEMMTPKDYLEVHGVDEKLNEMVVSKLSSITQDYSSAGFVKHGNTWVFELEESDSWLTMLNDIGDKFVSATINWYENGDFDHYIYDGFLKNMVEGFPTGVQELLYEKFKTMVSDDEKEDYDIESVSEMCDYLEDTFGGKRRTKHGLSAFLKNEPPINLVDLYDALVFAYYQGSDTGTSNTVYKALVRCAENISTFNLDTEPNENGKFALWCNPRTICALIDQDIDDWHDVAPEATLSEPREGYSGFDSEAALDYFLDEGAIDLGYPDLKYVDDMTMDEIRAELAELTNRDISDWDDVKLRQSLTTGRKNYWGRVPEKMTESMLVERMLVESAEISKLSDIASVKTNDPDADFWIVRRGSDEAVGMPTRTFNPEAYGIKITRTDLVVPDYLYYVMQHMHMQGMWKPMARGALRLVNIRADDIKNIPLKF